MKQVRKKLELVNSNLHFAIKSEEIMNHTEGLNTKSPHLTIRNEYSEIDYSMRIGIQTGSMFKAVEYSFGVPIHYDLYEEILEELQKLEIGKRVAEMDIWMQ